MKHASGEALDELEDLLAEIRKLPELKEKQRGVFYLKSKAFLHFHEDPAGLFADIKFGNEFQRFSLNSASEKKLLLSKIEKALRAN